MRISDWSSDVCSSDLDEDAASGGTGRRDRAQTLPDTALGLSRAGSDAGGPRGRGGGRSRGGPGRSRGAAAAPPFAPERKSVVDGTRGSVRVDSGGRRCIKKQKEANTEERQ